MSEPDPGPKALSPTEAPTVAVLTIGDEVLQGDVLNTNAHWLFRQCRARGAAVVHEATVRDREGEIGAELRHALGYAPRLILLCGGLGPTDDDRTAAAVAQALGLPLELDPPAREMVASFYARMHQRGLVPNADLTAPREKMARLPRGSVALENRLGAAPGVWISRPAVEIVLLPGVPEEMKDIVEHSLALPLTRWLGPGGFDEVERFAATTDESVLAPIVGDVAREHPDVYVKSRASAFGSAAAFRITLSSRAASLAEARERVARASAALERELARRGIALVGPLPT